MTTGLIKSFLTAWLDDPAMTIGVDRVNSRRHDDGYLSKFPFNAAESARARALMTAS